MVDHLATEDVRRPEIEKEEGIVQHRPAVALLSHLHEVWKEDEAFISTEELINRLVDTHPQMWGEASPFGKRLTAQRLGRMLVTAYNLHSSRPLRPGPRVTYVRP